jgi:hypothetical protein
MNGKLNPEKSQYFEVITRNQRKKESMETFLKASIDTWLRMLSEIASSALEPTPSNRRPKSPKRGPPTVPSRQRLSASFLLRSGGNTFEHGVMALDGKKLT